MSSTARRVLSIVWALVVAVCTITGTRIARPELTWAAVRDDVRSIHTPRFAHEFFGKWGSVSRLVVDQNTPRATSTYDSLFRGILVGPTGADVELQYIRSTQRQLVVTRDSGTLVHFAWTGLDEDPQSWEGVATYRVWSASAGTWITNPCRISAGTGGLGAAAVIGKTMDNEIVCAFHDLSFPSIRIASRFSLCPDSISLESLSNFPNCGFQVSPHLLVERAGSSLAGTGSALGQKVLHVVSGTASTSSDPCPVVGVAYHRFDPNTSSWSGPVLLDSGYGAVLTEDTLSGRLIVCYVRPRGIGSYNNDLVYLESYDSGLSWLDSVPDIANNITQHSATDPERPSGDLHCDFSPAGELHVMWTGIFFDEALGEYSDSRCNLRHWSEVSPGSNGPLGFSSTDLAKSAQWIPAGLPGSFNWNIAKISLSFGEGSTQCPGMGGPESNHGYIYATYSQFGSPDPSDLLDTSATGYQNGNIYMIMSRDDGRHWTPGMCLTSVDSLGGAPTRSPGCTGEGNPCLSESWGSMAELVHDTIHVAYVGDIEAGTYVFGEGDPGIGYYMYLSIPGGQAGALCLNCEGIEDVNGDGSVNVVDVVRIIDFVFRGGEEPKQGTRCDFGRGDINCDHIRDIVDVVGIINIAFRGGQQECVAQR